LEIILLLPNNTLPAGFIPESSHRTAFLIDVLKTNNILLMSTQEEAAQTWLAAPSEEVAGCNFDEFSSCETLVLVGQALNISTLHKLIGQFFPSAELITVALHALHGEFANQALQLSIYHNGDDALLSTSHLTAVSEAFFIDCFALSEVSLQQPGLLVMDMDSTIIDMECIDEIAALAGVGEKVSALTERAMQGELDFNQSLFARVGCLNGIDVAQLASLKSRLPINPGFAKTIEILHKHGWHTVIASGGFTYFANYLKNTFDLSDAFSNTLGIENNKLNGTVEGDIVNGEMKRSILLDQQRKNGLPPQQTVAIGDGANDLLMMEAAQLGVAYKAKPKVKAQANASIEYCGFEGLLYSLKQ